MMTDEDLKAIQQMMTNTMNLIIENQIDPKFKALAEGQQTILEKLAPKSRVEELEDEVSFLKSVIKIHTKEIEELKKAQ